MLVILDLQVGLYQIARDWDPTLYRENVLAHAELGKLFDLPVVMTTSAQEGPNGPLPKEILAMYPDAPLVKRQGEVEYVSPSPLSPRTKVHCLTSAQCLGQRRVPRRHQGYG
jgi:hypothetical protein